MPHPHPTGVVLSGGGANGAYEVGVLKALLGGKSPSTGHRPLEPGVIAATSIGSFNSAVLLSNLNGSWARAAAELEKVWLERISLSGRASHNGVFRIRVNPLSWIDVAMMREGPLKPARDLASDAMFLAKDWTARVREFTTSSGSLERRAAELVDLSTFVTPAPSEDLVRESVALAKVRSAAVALKVTATRWRNGTVRLFSNGDFTDAAGASILLASGAIPGIFPPVTIEGEPFVDGGVVLNTPLKPAVDAGAQTLHVIYLDPDPAAIPLKDVGSTIDTVGRMFAISFAATIKRDLEIASRINKGIHALEEAARGGSVRALEPMETGGRGHRPLRIHLYHPQSDWGGALGMLDFQRERVSALIERGYLDAVSHDCAQAGCIED
jgi:NTE family protein